MPWPKGKSRKGHVNKDGSVHAARGTKLREQTTMARTKRETTPPKVDSPVKEAEPHGDRPGAAVIERCPNCAYAYADGGYCSDCGWSKPLTNVHPYGTVTGRKYTR